MSITTRMKDFIKRNPYATTFGVLSVGVAITAALLVVFPPAGVASAIGLGSQLSGFLGLAGLSLPAFAATMGAIMGGAVAAISSIGYGIKKLFDNHPRATTVALLALAAGAAAALLVVFPPAGVPAAIGVGSKIATFLGLSGLSTTAYAATLGSIVFGAVALIGSIVNGFKKLVNSLVAKRLENVFGPTIEGDEVTKKAASDFRSTTGIMNNFDVDAIRAADEAAKAKKDEVVVTPPATESSTDNVIKPQDNINDVNVDVEVKAETTTTPTLR